MVSGQIHAPAALWPVNNHHVHWTEGWVLPRGAKNFLDKEKPSCRAGRLTSHRLTYLFIYSMEQSPSWEAKMFSASQEITRISWNPNVHYRSHKCPPPVPILSQLDPVEVYSLFRKRIRFYGEELLAPSPNPKLEGHPLSLSATVYSVYSQLPSILQAVPPSATWGRAMPWWQGPTYHGSRPNMCHIHYTVSAIPGH